MKLVKVKYTLEGCDMMLTMRCNQNTMKNEYMKALHDHHPEGGYVINEVSYSSFDIEEYQTAEE